MKTFLYIDGFNLYYSAVKGTPLRWLNPIELAARAIPHLCELPALKWKILNLEKLRRTNPKKFELQSTELARHFGE